MKYSALLLVLGIGMGATACGASQSTPATPSNAEGDSTSEAPTGAANKQGRDADDASRLLTHDECVSLGETVSGVCRDVHARSAQVEGWCGDVVSRYDSGAWVEDCTKHIHVIDSMCFRTANNARGMMSCDRTVDH